MSDGVDKKYYPTETTILMQLKREDGQSLSELSERVGISKMAILKHIQALEKRGILERRIVKKDVGRPYFRFHLLGEASSAFGSSTDRMFDSFLKYMDESGNRGLIVDFLRKRYKEVEDFYRTELSDKNGTARIEELARLRYLENYLPELRKIQGSKYEMLEYNCPIFTISKKYTEACDLERRLFQNVLRMNVNTAHTQINGHGTCRFLIDKDSR